MNLDIGRIVSTTLAMFKERFWPMVGLWAIFTAISIAFMIAFFIVLGTSIAGLIAFDPDGLEGAEALSGLGVSFFISILLFYFVFLAITFAQQASMSVMSSPIERPAFGEAISRGFKAGITFLALIIMFMVVYFIVALIVSVALAGLSLASSSASVVVSLLLIPVSIYFACRFAVIMPVVAVERVFNPFKAINRTWHVTQGRVLGILVVFLISMLAALAAMAVPGILFLSAGLGAGDPSALGGAAALMAILGFIAAIPMFIAYQIFQITLTACLHAQISDAHIEQVSEMFD